MSDQFVAEIRAFGFNFPPSGWAFCNGQLLPISQNTALFALLGTTYGGDGKSTFALPNLQGRIPMQQGQGSGLSLRDLGETLGSTTVTLLEAEIPSHTHALRATSDPAEQSTPAPDRALARAAPGLPYLPAPGAMQVLAPQTVAPAGSGQPHNNLPPVQVVNYCIALQGVFPPRP